MRLSEAIRLGATMKPQHFEAFYDDSGMTASCALGAAADAIGLRLPEDADAEWPESWLKVFRATSHGTCPECARSMLRFDPIPHLNDDHKWTRERIADWIELNFEPLIDSVPVAEPLGEADGISYVGLVK